MEVGDQTWWVRARFQKARVDVAWLRSIVVDGGCSASRSIRSGARWSGHGASAQDSEARRTRRTPASVA